MIRLPRPNISAQEVISACISTINEVDLQSRFLKAKSDLSLACEEAASLAAKGESHKVQQLLRIEGVSDDELKILYTENMVAPKGGARRYYNHIMNSSPRKKCPACGIGVVSTLDHYLPKSRYPYLSVSPINLFPCCGDCNKAKHISFPSSVEKQVCHPYFDDFTQAQWIVAEADRGPPVTVTYRVEAPSSWPDIDQKRVEHHFSVFKLAIPYTANGNDELVSLKTRLAELHKLGGRDEIKQYLEEMANRFSHRLNSWQYALYRHLASNFWFQDSGFSGIPDPT